MLSHTPLSECMHACAHMHAQMCVFALQIWRSDVKPQIIYQACLSLFGFVAWWNVPKSRQKIFIYASQTNLSNARKKSSVKWNIFMHRLSSVTHFAGSTFVWKLAYARNEDALAPSAVTFSIGFFYSMPKYELMTLSVSIAVTRFLCLWSVFVWNVLLSPVSLCWVNHEDISFSGH